MAQTGLAHKGFQSAPPVSVGRLHLAGIGAGLFTRPATFVETPAESAPTISSRFTLIAPAVETAPSVDRSLERLRESAELHPVAEEKSSLDFAVRAERLQCVEQLPHLHAWCQPEDAQQEYDSWTAPLAKFESDELLCLLDLTAAESTEALEEARPFHFSAHLCALVMDWTHWTLADMDEDVTSPRATHLRKTFDACYALFTALAQEADAMAESQVAVTVGEPS